MPWVVATHQSVGLRPQLALDSVGTVRLIGVDTPETVDPRVPVQQFGLESAEYLREMLKGQSVRLEYDRQRTDQYLDYSPREESRIHACRNENGVWGGEAHRLCDQKLQSVRCAGGFSQDCAKRAAYQSLD